MESRRRTRVKSHKEGVVEVDGRSVPFISEDISLHGLKCDTDEPLPEDRDCRVVIPLSDDVEVRIDARIIRTTHKTSALDFTGMDEESYSHLRNIVRFMSEDPDAIDEEQAERAFRG